jgi:hypothetical protein
MKRSTLFLVIDNVVKVFDTLATIELATPHAWVEMLLSGAELPVRCLAHPHLEYLIRMVVSTYFEHGIRYNSVTSSKTFTSPSLTNKMRNLPSAQRPMSRPNYKR